jgi:hypothetical protein
MRGIVFYWKFKPLAHELNIAHDGAPIDFKIPGEVLGVWIFTVLDCGMNLHHPLERRTGSGEKRFLFPAPGHEKSGAEFPRRPEK